MNNFQNLSFNIDLDLIYIYNLNKLKNSRSDSNIWFRYNIVNISKIILILVMRYLLRSDENKYGVTQRQDDICHNG